MLSLLASSTGRADSAVTDVDLPQASREPVDFAGDIVPLLRARCFDCHEGANSESGVRLDYFAKVLGESDGIPLVIPGNSPGSRLIQAVSGQLAETIMPPTDAGPRLTPEEIGQLRRWIDDGAVWDHDVLPDPNIAVAAKHWAFQPIVRPELPEGTEAGSNPIDAFIQAGLRQQGLALAASAEKRTLARRLFLVLQGMPPTENQVREFLASDDERAWSQLVESVLSSRHYGERMARHWLDGARWAESEGFAQNNDRPFAWRYRDYVVRSFNADISYADFIRQQIAGDELEPYSDENLIATGFLAAARISADDLHFYRVENDMYTDIVNTVSRSLLGLTIGCAQCHDHKFDPISQRDFYRLQAFFALGFPGNILMSGKDHPPELPDATKDLLEYDLEVRRRVLADGFDEQSDDVRELLHRTEGQRTLAQERAYRPERISLNIRIAGCNAFRIKPEEKKHLDELRDRVKQLTPKASQTWGFFSPMTSPHDLSTFPMAGNFPLLHDTQIFHERRSYLLARGQIFEPVAVVTPGWPAAFGPSDSDKLKSRPRSALADWLVGPNNPLTARVWVNRIWQSHFGRGLVSTPGNFGLQGSRPSHPRLLDWLARELIENNWSTKHIHRLIVHSATWRQSSRLSEDDRRRAMITDGDNVWLWRWPRRRLEAEAIRDAMLVASGELDRTVGGPSVPASEESTSARRGLYLFQKRDAPPAMQSLFDGPTAMAEACVERQVSTSALQSLYLLNSDFSRNRGLSLAMTIQEAGHSDEVRQGESAFRAILGRPPAAEERAAIRAFFAEYAEKSSTAKPDVHPLTDVTPRDAPVTRHLSLWLRADVGVLDEAGRNAEHGRSVSKWVDQRIGDNRAVNTVQQTAPNRRPLFQGNRLAGIGGRPVVRFLGEGTSDQFLWADDEAELRATTSYSAFAVVRFNGRGIGNDVVFVKARNGGNDVACVGLIRLARDGKMTLAQNIDGAWGDRLQSSEPVPDGVPVLVAVRWNGQRAEMDIYRHDGLFSRTAVDLPGKIDPGNGGRFSVGGYVDAFSPNGERMKGDVGEILFYRGLLSDKEMKHTADYLRGRWMKQPPLGGALAALCQALMNINEFVYVE